jgi:hypothetical protein
MPRGTVAPRVAWISFEPSGLAHAYRAGYGLAARTSICTEQVRHDPRFEWPETSRCPKCVAKVGALV